MMTEMFKLTNALASGGVSRHTLKNLDKFWLVNNATVCPLRRKIASKMSHKGKHE
jgi:hypothetical protein